VSSLISKRLAVLLNIRVQIPHVEPPRTSVLVLDEWQLASLYKMSELAGADAEIRSGFLGTK